MSFKEWSEYKTKQFVKQTYNPADFSSYKIKKELYSSEKETDLTPLERLTRLRDSFRSSYSNPPSVGEIDKCLTHAIAEITNLEKKVLRLEKDIERLNKDVKEANQDIINIQVGDETVVIDGDLATHVLTRAVADYVIEAIKTAAYVDEISDNFKI
jgi:chromosome condensin MukBEF ATPase and DNA-binding subunit MukB